MHIFAYAYTFMFFFSFEGMMKHIEPNGGISIPLEYASRGQLQFRPWGLKYEWSHVLTLGSLEKRAGMTRRGPNYSREEDLIGLSFQNRVVWM